jgi:hypothetical protein
MLLVMNKPICNHSKAALILIINFNQIFIIYLGITSMHAFHSNKHKASTYFSPWKYEYNLLQWLFHVPLRLKEHGAPCVVLVIHDNPYELTVVLRIYLRSCP